MKTEDAQKIYDNLNQMRVKNYYLTEDEHELLHDVSTILIDMYRKCVSLDDISDEELDENDYQ